MSQRQRFVGVPAWRAPYQKRPVRYAYTLTPKGRALGEMLLAFVRWGKQHIPGTIILKDTGAAAAQPKPGLNRTTGKEP